MSVATLSRSAGVSTLDVACAVRAIRTRYPCSSARSMSIDSAVSRGVDSSLANVARKSRRNRMPREIQRVLVSIDDDLDLVRIARALIVQRGHEIDDLHRSVG